MPVYVHPSAFRVVGIGPVEGTPSLDGDLEQETVEPPAETSPDARGAAEAGSVAAYMREIAKAALLDREGEHALAVSVHRARSRWVRWLARIPAAVDALVDAGERLRCGHLRLAEVLASDGVEQASSARQAEARSFALEAIDAVAQARRRGDRLAEYLRAEPAESPRARMIRRRLLRHRVAAGRLVRALDLAPAVLDRMIEAAEVAAEAERRAAEGARSASVTPRDGYQAKRAERELALLSGTGAAIARIAEARAAEARAKREFVEANLRLVVSVARAYRGHGMPFADIVQEGNVGLIKAVERYQPGRGTRLSTYAVWRIRQAIVEGLASSGRSIRLPRHVLSMLGDVAAARRDLAQEIGREPDVEAIAVRCGVEPAKIFEVLALSREALSLDAPVGDGEGATLADFVEDPEGERPAARAEGGEIRAILEEELRRLSPREERILRARYGFDGEHDLTLERIGDDSDVSRERVRQIETRALAKLRGRPRLARTAQGRRTAN